MSDKSPILFTKEDPEWGFLSNFYPSPFLYNGSAAGADKVYTDAHKWATAEHAFQAMKFPMGGPEYEAIRLASTPFKARQLGKKKSPNFRKDWDEIRLVYMSQIVYCKFLYNPTLKNKLLATGDRELIEAAPWDSFWGSGPIGTSRPKEGTGKIAADGSFKGANMLGGILMGVRDTFRAIDKATRK